VAGKVADADGVDIYLPAEASLVAANADRVSDSFENQNNLDGVDIFLGSIDEHSSGRDFSNDHVDVELDISNEYADVAKNASNDYVDIAKSASSDSADVALDSSTPESRKSIPQARVPPKRAGFFRRLLKPSKRCIGVERPFWRRWIYSIIFFVGIVLIWAPVLLFVTTAPPVYNSSWTIIIPGTQVGASVDLVNVGEAYTDVKTPYGGNSFSPGVNFKMIMSSISVMKAAADSLGYTVEEYGKPKIQVTDQAATLEVVFSGDTPEIAQEKSQALYNAFHAELDELRKDEVNARRAGSVEQLEAYRQEAVMARKALAEFRDQSIVVSADQYRAMVGTASNLEESLVKARVDKDAITSRLESMAETLGVDAYRAADVMLLRQDKFVQALSSEYATMQAEYIEQASVLGAKHPKVVHARARANAARFSMIERVRTVVGDVDEKMLSSYIPDPLGDDGQLYKEIVSFEAERKALNQEIMSSEQILAEMRGRIAVAGTDLDTLEKLETEHQTATTILVSATANLDLGRSNIYATYPLTQVLVEPTLPEKPKRLLKLLALLGGIIGTGLIVLSIIVVKYRDRWRQLILKKK